MRLGAREANPIHGVTGDWALPVFKFGALVLAYWIYSRWLRGTVFGYVIVLSLVINALLVLNNLVIVLSLKGG